MILADHCVYGTTIRVLEAAGYPVTRLKELINPDAIDTAVLRLAVEKDLVLLTSDRGLGNVLEYPPNLHQGVIVLRITAATEDQVHRVLLRALSELKRDAFRKKLVVVDGTKYRVRS